MAHISLPAGLPGISGPLNQYPETALHLRGLAQALLRGPSSLTPGEREMIATYVSSQNNCWFCTNSHRAATRYLLVEEETPAELVDQVCQDLETAPVNDKIRALLMIAGQVQQGGRRVSEENVAKARLAGADDKAIHDTVLIAAAFCMFNHYVDGLATWAPEKESDYEEQGALLAQHGYVTPTTG
ncbi:hypothetical protein IAD21_00764 [Abditibacteriota bacterium]|nr:hypothetical protein IAD21_00764 [Abditibacteriota bacterium]